MRRPILLVLALLVPLAGCGDRYSRPNRPLPEVTGTFLDGRPLTRADLVGKPYVLNLWVPG